MITEKDFEDDADEREVNELTEHLVDVISSGERSELAHVRSDDGSHDQSMEEILDLAHEVADGPTNTEALSVLEALGSETNDFLKGAAVANEAG